MIQILKSIGIVSLVIILNLAVLRVGIDEVFLMHGWGIVCWVVFMDAVQLAHELKLTQELLKSSNEKFHWLQDMYQREIHMSQIKHIEFINSFSSHASTVKDGLMSLSKDVSQLSNKSEWSPQSMSSDSKDSVPGIKAGFNAAKRKEDFRMQSIIKQSRSMSIGTCKSPHHVAIEALKGSGSCEF